VLGLIGCGACRTPDSRATDIVTALYVTGEPVVVDRDSVFEFLLADAAGRKMPGASLSVEGHMTHPGMAPIAVPAVDEGDGKYRVTLRFTMAGEWVLTLKGMLPDRRVLDQRLGGAVTVRPAG
jgi:hypothetical protein